MTSIDDDVAVRRLRPGDHDLGVATFRVMADVFEEAGEVLSAAYVTDLLAHPWFWGYVAMDDGMVAGGLTAHTLPMTRAEAQEVFLYDLAVVPGRQRRGIGRRLVAALVDDAAAMGLHSVFVPADVDDAHALDFYRSLGAIGSPVTMFELGSDRG